MNKMDDITLTHLFSFLFVFCFDKHLIKVSYRRKQRKEKRSKGKSIKRRRLFIYVLFSFFVKLTFSFLINKRYLYLLHVISTSARKYFILMNWKKIHRWIFLVNVCNRFFSTSHFDYYFNIDFLFEKKPRKTRVTLNIKNLHPVSQELSLSCRATHLTC